MIVVSVIQITSKQNNFKNIIYGYYNFEHTVAN